MKNSAFVDSLEAYRQSAPGRVVELDLTHLGVPTDVDVAGVDITTEDGSTWLGFGYGHSPHQALIGAYGEAFEQLGARQMCTKVEGRTGRSSNLPSDSVDPRDLTAEIPVERLELLPRRWLPARRFHRDATQRSGYRTTPTWLPAEYVAANSVDLALSNAGRNYIPLVHPVTNGLGAGPPDQAIEHAAKEVMQRDATNLRIRAVLRGARVPSDILAPRTQRVLEQCAAGGVEIEVVQLAEAGGLVTAYAYTRRSARPHWVDIGAGEACEFTLTAAADKAVCELVHSRCRLLFCHGSQDTLERLLPIGYGEVLTKRGLRRPRESPELAAFRRLKSDQGIAARRWVEKATRRDDGAAIAVQGNPTTMRPGIDAVFDAMLQLDLGAMYVVTTQIGEVTVARVLVGRAEVESLTYGRIGRRAANMIMADARLESIAKILTREAATDTDRTTDDLSAARDSRNSLLAALRSVIGPTYPLYREPAAHLLLRG